MLAQKPFSVERGHAAGAGRGHRLSINFILHIAAGKNSLEAGLGCAGFGFDVAGFIQFNLAV